ncbi:hypothetical protein D3C75_1390410 [compost metagenome]
MDDSVIEIGKMLVHGHELFALIGMDAHLHLVPIDVFGLYELFVLRSRFLPCSFLVLIR